MPSIIILVIFLGFSIAFLTYFIIKSIISPKKPSSMIQLYKQGKYSAAAKTAKQIMIKDPKSIDAHYCLGLSYIAEGKSELGLMELKTVNHIGIFTNFCTEKTGISPDVPIDIP